MASIFIEWKYNFFFVDHVDSNYQKEKRKRKKWQQPWANTHTMSEEIKRRMRKNRHFEVNFMLSVWVCTYLHIYWKLETLYTWIFVWRSECLVFSVLFLLLLLRDYEPRASGMTQIIILLFSLFVTQNIRGDMGIEWPAVGSRDALASGYQLATYIYVCAMRSYMKYTNYERE